MTWNDVLTWFTAHQSQVIVVLALIVIGFPVIRLIGKFLRSSLARRVSEQSAMLTSKAVLYGGNAVLLIIILQQMGVKLAPLLGAAGIAGVAIGFASQTSLSNFISGIFLIWEKPFQVNDVLDVSGTLGVVHSIDLLSVKLRTFDNKLVRIPNEALVKNTFTNVTRFPIRRFDLNISVAYKEDIKRVTEVLADVADKNPHALDEPAPIIIFKEFGASGLEFLLGVWFEKTNLLNLRTSLMQEVKERFDAEGIEIPFPHQTLYAGSQTPPFPIQIVDPKEALPLSTTPVDSD